MRIYQCQLYFWGTIATFWASGRFEAKPGIANSNFAPAIDFIDEENSLSHIETNKR